MNITFIRYAIIRNVEFRQDLQCKGSNERGVFVRRHWYVDVETRPIADVDLSAQVAVRSVASVDVEQQPCSNCFEHCLRLFSEPSDANTYMSSNV